MPSVSLPLRFLRQPLKIGIALLLPLLAFAQIPLTPSAPSMDTLRVLRDASIEFPESAKIRPSPADVQTARIDTEVVTVQRGDDLVGLLADNGIRQDATSLALLYELNPQLEDIRKIVVGEKLIVPEIQGTMALESAFRRGYRVELMINQLVATQTLSARTAQIRDLESTLSSLAAERFDSPQDRAAIMKIIEDALAALTILAHPEPKTVVSRKVANQAAVEGEAIRSKISRMVESGRSISMGDVEDIKASADNLKAIGQEVKSGGSSLILTTIRTIGATNGEPVSQLTVWYAPQADRDKKQPCSKVSSPSIEAIARGDYLFWATRGNEVVTDEKPRKVRSFTRDVPLDLLVH